LTDLRLDAGKHRKQRRTGWHWQLKGFPMNNLQSIVSEIILDTHLLIIEGNESSRNMAHLYRHREVELSGMIELAKSLNWPAEYVKQLAGHRVSLLRHSLESEYFHPADWDFDPNELPF
jgi:hypothetical protein